MKIPTNRTLIMKDDYSDIRHALCASMGMMFERVVDQKDLIDFSLRFFKSDVYKRYPDDWTIFSQSPLYVLQLFKEELQEKTGKSYDTLIKQSDKYEKDVAYWFGFLITDWRVGYDFDTSSLTRDNLIWLYVNYDTLHTQSCKYVYEVFQEEKGQTFPDIQL